MIYKPQLDFVLRSFINISEKLLLNKINLCLNLFELYFFFIIAFCYKYYKSWMYYLNYFREKNLIIVKFYVKYVKKLILDWIRRKTWKPKGKIYSLKCNQCGNGFISNHSMEAPICGICLQKIKSIDLTVDTEKKCIICGRNGAVYSSNKCNDCYFKN